MKLKIERQFKDKYTGQLYRVDDVIEVDDARGAELAADDRGLVTVIKETEKPADTPAPKKPATKVKTASKTKATGKSKKADK